jgi:hypothetical protein
MEGRVMVLVQDSVSKSLIQPHPPPNQRRERIMSKEKSELTFIAAMAMQGLLHGYFESAHTPPIEKLEASDTRMTIAQLSVIAAKSLLAELEKEQA